MADPSQTGRGGTFDCLIIGGGPAGLTAATYLEGFRRRVIAVDAGQSRAKWIPVSNNCPGFPDGTAGLDLLEQLRQQVRMSGVDLVDDTVRDLSRDGGDFIANTSALIQARTVLIATGILDTLPDAPDVSGMIAAGSLRLCPICDAYEVIDKRIALIGPGDQAMKKHCSCVLTPATSPCLCQTLQSNGMPRPSDVIRRAGIHVVKCIPDRVHSSGHQAGIELAGGGMSAFDTISRHGLHNPVKARHRLGSQCDDIRNLVVDSRQRTVIPRLYAAGTSSTKSTRSRWLSGTRLWRQPTCTIIFPTTTKIG